MLRTARLAAAVLGVLVTLSPTAAGAATPEPAPATGSAPSQATLDLERLLTQRRAQSVMEQTRLGAAAVKATEALQASQQAQRSSEDAARELALQDRRHRAAQARTGDAQRALRSFASSLYRRGGESGQAAWYLGAVGGADPRQLLGNLDLAERVGDHQGNALTQLEQAEADQQQAADDAQKAARAQRVANQRAAAARAAADRVVAEARQAVAASAAFLTKTQDAVLAARQRDALLARARLIARQRSMAPVAAVEGALAPRPGATCAGGVLRGFPNGQLPEQALCPLWGTSGHMLRADASAAFAQMSQAYAAFFGTPLCVTDSYRTLGEQIALAAAKPTLAARPGTSNHGWAVAVDLCDGVQTFGTPQHLWLVGNSMRFGWFHPTWAQQTGSRPEPWHWEFAG